MGRFIGLLGDVFWSALMVLALLIVAYFILRQAGRIRPLQGVVGKVQDLATPAG